MTATRDLPPVPDWSAEPEETLLGGIGPYMHTNTKLADGRPSILIDPGSVGNLAGVKWAREVAKAAAENGQKPHFERRPRPLRVSGVGNGAQECHHNCHLPIAFKPIGDGPSAMGNLTVPTVPESDLPGLLGLTALRDNRVMVDSGKLLMYFPGPDEPKIESHMPPGTDVYQCELAPSGHMVLPCCE